MLDLISVEQIPDQNAALGLAARYAAARQPFGSYRADRLIGSIAGQVQRGHYGFAIRAGIIAGYVGWALCEPATAREWIEGGRVPTPDQCNQGDMVVVLMVIADDPQVLRRLHAYLRTNNPGRDYIGRRAQRPGDPVRRGRIGLKTHAAS
ncbi:hypothetical protein [Microvirga solisilvae]|uniref:hypothetical protein n=1 Tax=Microvirga solisilvae TaxID=2919498 RepID=UPI001FAFEF9B|nr:hypothetical protein [Microvirga solisilvae]